VSSIPLDIERRCDSAGLPDFARARPESSIAFKGSSNSSPGIAKRGARRVESASLKPTRLCERGSEACPFGPQLGLCWS
jgi:hypothetical protein